MQCTFATTARQVVSACLYCPTGTIADETASTTCRACAPGSSTATLGTVICNNCSVGSYQKVSGQTSCVSCNAGFFVPSIGQTACQACESGFCQRPRGSESMLLLFFRLYSSLYNKTSLSRFCSSRSDVGHQRWPGFRRHGATHRVSLNLGTCCFSMLASWPQVSAVCPPRNHMGIRSIAVKMFIIHILFDQLFGVGALAHRGLPPFIGGLCGDHSPHCTTMTQTKCCPILHFGLWWLPTAPLLLDTSLVLVLPADVLRRWSDGAHAFPGACRICCVPLS